jgi:arginase family enzyme
MAKVTQEKLAEYKTHDRTAFEFADDDVARFFARAAEEGFSLDTTGFLANPGFFQAPYRREATSDIDIAIVGCPLDLGAIGLAGARHGPKAVREGSRNYGPINDVTGNIPFEQCSIVDYGDVDWSRTDLETRVTQDIPAVFEALGKAGIATLSCGGEHTTSYGALKGLAAAHDDSFGLLHIDAHCDTMAVWGGDTINDGSVFRQAVLDGFIDPERTVQIGIRGRSDFLWEFSHDTGMTVISADEVFAKGTAYVIDKAKEIVGSEKAYFSFDVDGLDSAVMMGTTGPEPFGLTPRQARDIIHGVRELNFIGADMVELNPSRDPNGYCTHLAAAIFYELLCLLADVRERQHNKKRPTRWVLET